MKDHFEDYRAFDSIETARVVLLDILDKNDIPYALYKDPYRQDVILGRGMDLIEIWVQLKPADFTRVNRLLRQEAEKRNEEVAPDYYLREMRDENLIEILKKPDEWSIDDYVIAGKILAENGIDIPEQIKWQWKLDRRDELKNGKRKESDVGDVIDPGATRWPAWRIFSSQVNKDTGKREILFDQTKRSPGKITLLIGALILLAIFILLILKKSKL